MGHDNLPPFGTSTDSQWLTLNRTLQIVPLHQSAIKFTMRTATSEVNGVENYLFTWAHKHTSTTNNKAVRLLHGESIGDERVR